MSKWEQFTDKVIRWADSESNGAGLMFTASLLNEETIKISSKKNNKTFIIKFTKKEYDAERKKHMDEEILAMIFQILREKYRNVHGMFSMNYFHLRCKRHL